MLFVVPNQWTKAKILVHPEGSPGDLTRKVDVIVCLYLLRWRIGWGRGKEALTSKGEAQAHIQPTETKIS